MADGAAGVRCHGGGTGSRRIMGWPQQGQGRAGAAGFATGAAGGGQPVAAARVARFFLAAG